MARSIKLGLAALALAGLLWLSYSLFAASTVTFTSAEERGGGVRFDTQLPNAACTKTFSARFPFVSVSCTPAAPSETLP